MKEGKIIYFDKPGRENTDKALDCAKERLKEGDIKTVLIASSSGETGLKAYEKFKDLDVKVIIVTISGGKGHEERRKILAENIKKMDELKISYTRGTHALSGIERAVKARWGTAGPVLLMADTLRIFGDGTKVGIEITVMACGTEKVSLDENIMTIAGTSKGADTVMIVKSAGAANFFDIAIREYICKPYTDGVKHEAR